MCVALTTLHPRLEGISAHTGTSPQADSPNRKEAKQKEHHDVSVPLSTCTVTSRRVSSCDVLPSALKAKASGGDGRLIPAGLEVL